MQHVMIIWRQHTHVCACCEQRWNSCIFNMLSFSVLDWNTNTNATLDHLLGCLQNCLKAFTVQLLCSYLGWGWEITQVQGGCCPGHELRWEPSSCVSPACFGSLDEAQELLRELGHFPRVSRLLWRPIPTRLLFYFNINFQETGNLPVLQCVCSKVQKAGK